MRIFKRLRNDIILVVVLCAAGYVAYQVLLDDKAKEGLSSMTKTIVDSYQTLSDTVNEHIGTIMDEDVVAQNKEQIRQAWEAIGF